MNFAQPIFLWLLALVAPALAGFLWWADRRRARQAEQFVTARLLSRLTAGLSRRRQRIRAALRLLAVLLLLLALARPQWGFNWEEVRQRGLDILVAIDTSRSMLATDVAPSRLERAKLEALSLMGRAKSDRLGLIAFAGSAFLQCPLTLDNEAFSQSVRALDTTIIPQGGTALAEAITTATRAFEKTGENHQVLVLFTDGEDHAPDAPAAARAAAEAGIRIFTVGFGTAEGELLRVRDEQGTETFVKDEQGNVVKSRLNEPLLQQLATIGQGFYLNVRGAGTMDVLYERGLAPLPKREFSAKLIKRLHEQYHWPLGLAVLLLVIESLLPERARGRAGAPATTPPAARAAARLALGLMLFSSFSATAASESAAQKAYAGGRYDVAFKEFESLLQRRAEDARLHYNAGVAAHRAGDYDAAALHLQRAAGSKESALQQKALYNLGNTRYRQGELAAGRPDQQRARWEEALKHFDTARQMNPQDADAAFNYEFVKQKLEELKQQQQQPPKPQPQPQSGPQPRKDDPNQDQQPQQQDQRQEQQPAAPQKSDQASGEQQSGQSAAKDAAPRPQEQQQKSREQSSPEHPGRPETQSGQPDEARLAGAQGSAVLLTMTPQQAQQLLESHRGEEQVLLFQPPPPTNAPARRLKDW